MTQIGVVEHLKLENVTLSHQLTETQHRSIKDKERIAVQLQSIEVHSQPTIFVILITGWNTDEPYVNIRRSSFCQATGSKTYFFLNYSN